MGIVYLKHHWLSNTNNQPMPNEDKEAISKALMSQKQPTLAFYVDDKLCFSKIYFVDSTFYEYNGTQGWQRFTMIFNKDAYVHTQKFVSVWSSNVGIQAFPM